MKKKTLIFSDGRKGGVGKSTTSICLIDYLLSRSKNVLVIDVDVTNAEVARLFQNTAGVASLAYDLRLESEWMAFGNSVEMSKNVDYVVVNLPGSIDISPHLNIYADVFRQLGYEICVFFTISRQADSINLLGESLNGGAMSMADTAVVVKNGLFGLEDDFHRYYASETHEQFLSQGGIELYIRELFHESLDLCLLTHKKTFSLAIKEEMNLFPRYQIRKWVDDMHAEIDKVFALSQISKEEKKVDLPESEPA